MDADQWGSGIAAIEQEGEEDGRKHHNVQLELIGWEGTDGLPTPQTQQPTAELNREGIDQICVAIWRAIKHRNTTISPTTVIEADAQLCCYT